MSGCARWELPLSGSMPGDKADGRTAGRAVGEGGGDRPPDRRSARPPLLREVPIGDSAVPRMELAGWRGTAGGILERGVELVKRMAFVRSGGIVMHCGVGICGECYEVGSEVLSRFSGRAETAPGHVDLRVALAQQGGTLGLGGITLSPWCSAHDREPFFSHLASGGRDGRMIAYATLPA